MLAHALLFSTSLIMGLKSCVTFFVVLTAASMIISVLIWSMDGTTYGFDSRIIVHLINSTGLSNSKAVSIQQWRRPAPISNPRYPIPSVILAGTSGGIGNQLFKYAFGYTLARQLNASLFIKFSRPGNRRFSPRERVFVLDQFNLDESSFSYLKSSDPLPDQDVVKLKEVDFFEKRIPTNKILVLDDYWESEIFFEPCASELVTQYQMKLNMNDSEIYKQIAATESVAVHFRIGDFNGTTRGNDRVLPFDYHVRAMELARTLISGELTFFVFSDDMKYVKSQMQARNLTMDQIVFVSNPSSFTSLEEFYLMRSCKHIITPNSSFSWWAAYLNSYPNKTVIVPYPRNRPKFFDRYKKGEIQKYKRFIDQNYLYPLGAGWITLDPFVDEAL